MTPREKLVAGACAVLAGTVAIGSLLALLAPPKGATARDAERLASDRRILDRLSASSPPALRPSIPREPWFRRGREDEPR